MCEPNNERKKRERTTDRLEEDKLQKNKVQVLLLHQQKQKDVSWSSFG
jgi:hypothetical protein